MTDCDCDATLTLPEALADPLVLAMMAADGVDPDRLADELETIAREVERRTA